ncbi:hypothetical protein NEFER03_1799 [Nematocida sp. LUAm3]|nr:hypothetical protein NEFER03_1799 [Nematocida sp. LUAm3]KAI5177361.1 hypothetical protein NEFER01_0636 [Nematocida sp. LUAm1]
MAGDEITVVLTRQSLALNAPRDTAIGALTRNTARNAVNGTVSNVALDKERPKKEKPLKFFKDPKEEVSDNTHEDASGDAFGDAYGDMRNCSVALFEEPIGDKGVSDNTSNIRIKYIYRNILNGALVCGETEEEKVLWINRIFPDKKFFLEKNFSYQLSYIQKNLPDQFYVAMNGQRRLLGVTWIDMLINRYFYNGYLLRKSFWFEWYRKAFMPLSSGKTGKEIDIYVIDGHMDTPHREIEGRVKVFPISKKSKSDHHSTSVITAAGGETLGLAKESNFHLYSAFSNGKGYLGDILHALDKISEKASPSKSLIILPFSGPPSSLIDRALEHFYHRKIHSVSSAGNQASNSCLFSPGRSKYTVTVGSISDSFYPYSWSNTGECISVYSPGSLTVGEPNYSSYVIRKGTSLSAAFTAGYIAQLIEDNQYTPQQVLDHFSSLSRRITPLPNYPSTFPSISSSFSYNSPLLDAILFTLLLILLILPFLLLKSKSKKRFIKRGPTNM